MAELDTKNQQWARNVPREDMVRNCQRQFIWGIRYNIGKLYPCPTHGTPLETIMCTHVDDAQYVNERLVEAGDYWGLEAETYHLVCPKNQDYYTLAVYYKPEQDWNLAVNLTKEDLKRLFSQNRVRKKGKPELKLKGTLKLDHILEILNGHALTIMTKEMQRELIDSLKKAGESPDKILDLVKTNFLDYLAIQCDKQD